GSRCCRRPLPIFSPDTCQRAGGTRSTLPRPTASAYPRVSIHKARSSGPGYAGSMIPGVEPEGRLLRKPVSTPDHVRGMLFGIMLWAKDVDGRDDPRRLKRLARP